MNNTGTVDRVSLKLQARDWMRRAVPAFWLAALVYQAVTNLLPNVISGLIPYTAQITAELYTAIDYLNMGDSFNAVNVLMDILSTPAGYVTLFISIALSLFSGVVGWGYKSYAVGTIRGENPGVQELFSRFYMAGKIVLAMVLEVVFVSLWSMLFVFPGIVAAYRYRMVVYLLLDDPDCPVLEAFDRSKLLMLGRKWELFTLDLSFFGWELLLSLVSSIPTTLLGMTMLAFNLESILLVAGTLLLMPYREFTWAGWYEAIRPKEVARETPQEDSFG